MKRDFKHLDAKTILLNLLESGWGIQTVAPDGSRAAEILMNDPEKENE